MKWSNGVAKRYSERRIKKILESLDQCKGHWEENDYFILSRIEEIREDLKNLLDEMEESKNDERESPGRGNVSDNDTPTYGPSDNDKRELKVKEILSQLYSLKKNGMQVNSPEIAALLFAPMTQEEIEVFSCIYVDNKNRLIAKEIISRGTVDQAPVFPREVIKKALLLNASGIVLGHNHPGGDPEPSLQDRELTTKLKRIAIDMGLRILDHVVISDSGHFSFQEHGYV